MSFTLPQTLKPVVYGAPIWRLQVHETAAGFLEAGLSACLLHLLMYAGELREDAVCKEEVANTNIKLLASQVRVPCGHWLVPTVGK